MAGRKIGKLGGGGEASEKVEVSNGPSGSAESRAERAEFSETMELNSRVEGLSRGILTAYGFSDEMIAGLMKSESEDVAKNMARLMDVAEELIAEWGTGVWAEEADPTVGYPNFELPRTLLGVVNGDGAVFVAKTEGGKVVKFFVEDVRAVLRKLAGNDVEPVPEKKLGSDLVVGSKNIQARVNSLDESIGESPMVKDKVKAIKSFPEQREIPYSREECAALLEDGLDVLAEYKSGLGDFAFEGKLFSEYVGEFETLVRDAASVLVNPEKFGDFDFDQFLKQSETAREKILYALAALHDEKFPKGVADADEIIDENGIEDIVRASLISFFVSPFSSPFDDIVRVGKDANN